MTELTNEVLTALSDRKARGERTSDLAREIGVSPQRLVSELKRMKELEAENAKLKRMYAELALENAAIKDLLSRKL